MSGRVKIVIILFMLVVLGMIGYRFVGQPIIHNWQQQQTSDAAALKGKITLAYDNWVGYYPLCSIEMKKQMRNAGWLLDCKDDKANYAERMDKLKNRSIDFAVATVDSYILNAAPKGFPGVTIAVIDESKGGDAMVAWEDKAKNLDALRRQTNLRIAFTPQSPSDHLRKAIADHFDLPELLVTGERKIETNGSEEALKKFLERKADVAILWEPDVSKALAEKGVVKLIGTEKTERLIVDILLANRKYSTDKPEVVHLLLSTYFRVLKFYRDNPEILEKEILAENSRAGNKPLTSKAVKDMLKGVRWTTLQENAELWFGIAVPGSTADAGLVTTIESTVKILVSSKDFPNNPLPDGDPFRITQKKYVEDLVTKGFTGFTEPGAKQSQQLATDSLRAPFTPLNETGWGALKPVGTLKLEPITFQAGRADLQLQEKEKIDAAVEKLKHYPSFRILVKGHTGLSGDPTANRELSQERAESVARYLAVTYAINENRLRAVGLGSTEPLPHDPGESERGYHYRLPRVEVVLVSEVY